MRILFDYCIFQSQRIGGVSKSIVEMMTRLPSDIEVEVAVKESDNIYLRENGSFGQYVSDPERTFGKFLPNLHFKGKTRLYRALTKLNLIEDSGIKNRNYCISRIKQGDYDVYQPTGYNSFFLPYNKKPFVFIVHDIIPELFPDYYPRDFCDIQVRDILVKKAARIVVPSENTKKDVLKWWKLDENKVEAIPWGAPDVTGIAFKKPADYPYILFVGDRNRYKRFPFFVRETATFLQRQTDVHVICTGKSFTEEENGLFLSLGLSGRFHSVFVSSEELFSLYHYALCFVYPSQYEGFGLPTLEAMACGCPVILTDSSSFPEVGGEAALYIEEKDGHSNLTDLLVQLYDMPTGQREELAIRCIERAGCFSWDETAGKYASVYRSLL